MMNMYIFSDKIRREVKGLTQISITTHKVCVIERTLTLSYFTHGISKENTWKKNSFIQYDPVIPYFKAYSILNGL